MVNLLILITFLFSALFVVIIGWGIVIVVRRFFGAIAGFCCSLLAVAVWAYLWIDTYISCSQDPVFTDPTPKEAARGSAGGVEFACDGPVGILATVYTNAAAPIAFILLLWLTIHAALKLPKFNSVKMGNL